MLTEVCVGENMFREGSSTLELNCAAKKLQVPQKLNQPFLMRKTDFSNNMDQQDLSAADVQDGLFGVDLNSAVEKLSVTQKLSDHICSETVDALDPSEEDLQENSSAIDHNSSVEKLSVLQQFELSCLKNDDLNRVDAQDLCADIQEGTSAINLLSTTEIPSQQFSEPACIKSDDLSNEDAHDLFGADVRERSSSVGLDCETVSVSQKLSIPFSVEDCDFSKSICGPDFSRDVTLVAAFGSIDIGESIGQHDNGGIDATKLDAALVPNVPGVISPSKRRWSLRKTKYRQNSQSAKPIRNGRGASRKVLLDMDVLQISKRRRSCSSKRARSSVWGSLTNTIQEFEQNGDIDINVNELKNPIRARGGKATGKQKKSQSRKSTMQSKSTTSRLSFKIKIGKKITPASVMDAVSTDENIEGHPETMGVFPDLSKQELLPESIGFHRFDENSEKMDGSIYLSCKNLVENLSTGGLDPGTSPDSEVINLNPDAAMVNKGQNELHDLLSSSKPYVDSGGVSSLSAMQDSRKKVNKGKMLQAGEWSPKDELLNSEIMDNGQQSAHIGQEEKEVDHSCSTDASASITILNASGTTSSSEGISKGPLSTRVADFGRSCVTSVVDGGLVVNLPSRATTSQISDKVLPHNKGRKIPKSAKMEGVRKSRSEIPASAKKKGSTSTKKLNQDKSISKHKVREEFTGGLASFELESCAETGSLKLLALGEPANGNSSLTGNVSTLDLEPSGLKEQFSKPRNAWVLCDDCHKWRRIAATLADQIEETNCRWTCKDNMDKIFADCSIPQEKSNAEINAELEISDASGDDEVFDARVSSNRPGKKHSTVAQQSTWRLIKSNLFLHRNRKTQTIDEIMVCHCKPPLNGRMGCGDGCLNRMLNIECVQRNCPCGDRCSNQQFQKRNYAKLKWFRCGKKGYGLQVLEDISEGRFLIEYVGEVLDVPTYEARQRDYALKGHKHFYFMTLNGSEVIDACAKGNLGRFINHSCDPNCRTEKWMVNGEVCIGLFALRNIKKGEEVTFDYNYVRVFGAAAKKCVCGSSQCRGYIGGDPQSTEIIVQDDSDDEYPEPVMVNEHGGVHERLKEITLVTSSFHGTETRTSEKPPKDMDKLDESKNVVKPLDTTSTIETDSIDLVETGACATAVGHVEVIEESEDPLNGSESGAVQVDISTDIEGSSDCLDFSAKPNTALKPDDLSSGIMTDGEQECFEGERSMKMICCSTAGLEENSASTVLGKLLPDVTDSKRKLKPGAGKRRVKSSKSQPLTRPSDSSASVKKGKCKTDSPHVMKLQVMQTKYDELHGKPKKLVEASSSGRFEAVQEKLNELLNDDGGISKRKDASRGYLKLLLLTAASGDGSNGETIQSNRDLSMILDALLKTKSRTVLVDVINKNGLQMLHNMLKRYRKVFNKIPILRKLLKVFEYLATREILTSEHINGGPTCPGVESFRESILSFTEHIDKQVHQIARNFRDRWIPRSARKNNCMDWEDSKLEFHRGAEPCRFQANDCRDQPGKHSETPDSIKESSVRSSTVDAGIVGDSCAGKRVRKRKSRWDQPEDLDRRAKTNTADDGRNNIDDDVPPGFPAPLNAPGVPSEASSNSCGHAGTSSDLKDTHPVVLGQPQQRFLSRLPVSYGVPLDIVKQAGTPLAAGKFESWSVAPGMPFHPFPPLPPYPRVNRDPPSNAADSSLMDQPAMFSGQDPNEPVSHTSSCLEPRSLPEANSPNVEMPGANNKLNFQQSRGSNTLGRKYFRQQKWNGPKLGPPWLRNRNNWGFTGNNSRNGMCNIGVGSGTNEFRNSHGWERGSREMADSAPMYHQHQP